MFSNYAFHITIAANQLKFRKWLHQHFDNYVANIQIDHDIEARDWGTY